MPLVVKLLLLGEGIVGKVFNRKRTHPDRQTDFSSTRLMECRGPATVSYTQHTRCRWRCYWSVLSMAAATQREIDRQRH